MKPMVSTPRKIIIDQKAKTMPACGKLNIDVTELMQRSSDVLAVIDNYLHETSGD